MSTEMTLWWRAIETPPLVEVVGEEIEVAEDFRRSSEEVTEVAEDFLLSSGVEVEEVFLSFSVIFSFSFSFFSFFLFSFSSSESSVKSSEAEEKEFEEEFDDVVRVDDVIEFWAPIGLR